MAFYSASDDVKIHYDTYGTSGDWLFLLAGYARPVNDFQGMGRFLAARGWRVVAMDARGAGKAECPPAFTLEDIADDAIALAAKLGIASAHFFGAGLGGSVAVLVAAKAPKLVTSLVLAAAPVHAKHVQLELLGPGRTAQQFQKMVMRYFSPGFLAGNAPLVQGYVRQMARLFMEPDTALGAACQRAAMEALDLAPLLAKVTARTLVLHGEHDFVVPTEAAEQLAEGIGNATREVWPASGHLLVAEAPTKLYERVDVFCRATDD